MNTIQIKTFISENGVNNFLNIETKRDNGDIYYKEYIDLRTCKPAGELLQYTLIYKFTKKK